MDPFIFLRTIETLIQLFIVIIPLKKRQVLKDFNESSAATRACTEKEEGIINFSYPKVSVEPVMYFKNQHNCPLPKLKLAG